MENEKLTHTDLGKAYLEHHGVKGMKWGVRRFQPYTDGKKGKFLDESKKKAGKALTDASRKTVQKVYAVGAKVNPRELKYTVKRTFSSPKPHDKSIVDMVNKQTRETGVLPTDENIIASIDRKGMQAHKDTKYNNLDKTDIDRFKKYTDAAVYSRAVNTYLATGEPKHIAEQAQKLKESIGKNKLNDQVVYRSTSLQFSTDGLANKLDQHGEEALKGTFDQFDKNFKGKSFKENRIYSTSTSPSFAIDTWRKVNPTAAKNYNSYLVINTKGTSGVMADGRTSDGKTLVNTRSNQEAILAPEKMTYRKIAYDKDRGMFAVYLDAE